MIQALTLKLTQLNYKKKINKDITISIDNNIITLYRQY